MIYCWYKSPVRKERPERARSRETDRKYNVIMIGTYPLLCALRYDWYPWLWLRSVLKRVRVPCRRSKHPCASAKEELRAIPRAELSLAGSER